MRKPRQLALDVPIKPHMRDHHVEGKAVLSAVEVMRLLADAVIKDWPRAPLEQITDVRFDRFLTLPAGSPRLAAIAALTPGQENAMHAALATRLASPKTTIKRTLRHAELRFCGGIVAAPLPVDVASSLEGVCIEIDAARVYRDLIAFGPAFQNLRHRLYLSRDGVLARVAGSPRKGAAPDAGFPAASPLGAVFPLDAALQAACVWGQCFAGVVAFPVGIDKRILPAPTVSGESYLARVIPQITDRQTLCFDIWIYDRAARLREAALGVRMRDVSRGRMQPPSWIMARKPGPVLGRLKPHCAALSLMGLAAVVPMAESALSAMEKQRLANLGAKRRARFLAARMACKRIFRTLSGGDRKTPAAAISTVHADLHRPRCSATGGLYRCSVSHDSRFVVAAASRKKVGIDVERVSDRVLNSRDLFMAPGEAALVTSSGLDPRQACVRVWSIKEAVAKAADIPLADSWRRTRVLAINAYQSRVQIDGRIVCDAWHDYIGTHVFTLVKLDESETDRPGRKGLS